MGSFSRGNWSGCEPIYWPPSGDVRNEWSLNLQSPYFFIFYRRVTLHLHNNNVFYTEVFSMERERVVFSDEAESCIVGSLSFGITSPTSDVLL
jgi:hypothetical protein